MHGMDAGVKGFFYLCISLVLDCRPVLSIAYSMYAGIGTHNTEQGYSVFKIDCWMNILY